MICSDVWPAWRMVRLSSWMVLFIVLQAGRAPAEVADSAANGFTLVETAHVAGAPDKVYAALIAPARWWSADHTYSGDAANLTLDARAGGCWCETLPDGGSVLHMTVVYAAPGKALRLRGALGPFQAMAADGAMTWSLKPGANGTDVTLTYALVGYAIDGFDRIADAADGVLNEQVTRLKLYVETGSPDKSKEDKP
jgi:uncharacterized protein YndB with AHSA1/START domain